MRSCITITIPSGAGLNIEIRDAVERTVVDASELVEKALEAGNGVWYQRADGAVRILGAEALRSAVILVEPSSVYAVDKASQPGA